MQDIKILENNNEAYLYIRKLTNKIKQINVKNNKIKITYLSENKREYDLSKEQLNILKDKKYIKVNELSQENGIIDLYSVNLFFDF